jgi:hypothetical protein
MDIKDLLATGGVRQPWPLLIDGSVAGSSDMGISETCKKKCGVHPACASNRVLGEHICQHNLSYFNKSMGGSNITIYGVRSENNKTPLNIYTRAGIKGRHVTLRSVDQWIGSIQSLLSVIDSEFLKRQSEMLDPLHDPMRLAKQISTISNRLVQSESVGVSFDLQVENAPFELKALVKAAELLNDSFDLLAIYFNPAAATYGEITSISIHGLLKKLVSIFRVDEHSHAKESAKIYLGGECFRNVSVYESFKLIPFSLLSNAVKYSVEGSIRVAVEDRRPAIRVSVESVGPYIEDGEVELIFKKNGRGKWAKEMEDGKGVGLYLAHLIAKAHGFNIDVTSRKNGKRAQANVPLAVNTFSFEIDPGKPLPYTAS